MARTKKVSTSPPVVESDPTFSAAQFGAQCEQKIRDALSDQQARAATAVEEGKTPFQLYPHQRKGILNFAAKIGEGKFESILKHTVGAGKTNVAGFVVESLDFPALLLEPFVSLVPAAEAALRLAAQELQRDKQSVHVVADLSDRITDRIRDIVTQYERDPSIKPRVIMTYAGFISLCVADPDLFAQFSAMIGVVVSDEVHLSFGKKTQAALGKARGLGLDKAVRLMCAYLSDNDAEVKQSFAKLCEDLPSAGIELLVAEAVDHLFSKGVPLDKEHEAASVIRHQQLKGALLELFSIVEICEADGDALGWKEKDRLTSQTADSEEVFRHVIESLNTISEAIVRSALVSGPRKTPMIHLLLTGTLPFLVEEAEEVVGIPVADVVTMHELDAAKIVILPTERNVGFARRTETGAFMMDDGRSVLTAVLDDLEKLRGTYGQGLPPTIITCPTIREAEIGREEAVRRGIRAIRCTTGNRHCPEGMPILQGKAALELPPDDPNRVEVMFVVRQGATGLDIPTLRTYARLWPSNPRPLVQAVGRINRSLRMPNPWPEKNHGNTNVISPTFVDKVSGRNVYYPGVAEALIIAGEIPIEFGSSERTNVKDGRRFHSNIPFEPRKHDHVRHLIGSIHALVDKGLPIDLSKTTFSRKELGVHWRVTGARLIKAYCPTMNGQDAARYIGILLWPKASESAFFNGKKTDHLREVFGTAERFFTTGKLGSPFFGGAAVKVAEHGWELPSSVVLSETFGTTTPSVSSLRGAVEAAWPLVDTLPVEWFEDVNLAKIKAMLGDRERCLDAEFFARIFEYDGKKIVGWRLFERLVETQSWDLHGKEPRTFLADVFFPKNGAATEEESGEETNGQHFTESIKYVDHGDRRLSEDRDARDLLKELLGAHGVAEPEYQDSPTGFPPPRGLVAASCTALGLRVVSFGRDRHNARQWAAREMIHEIGERRHFKINRLPVETTEKTVRRQYFPSDVDDKALDFVCGDLIRRCYTIGAPQPIATVYEVDVRGDLLIYRGQVFANNREALTEGSYARGAISEGCKAVVSAIAGRDNFSATAIKQIVFHERCFIGLLARDHGMPNVNKLIDRCSRDPRFPMTLLDGRMKIDGPTFTASYSINGVVAQATKGTECEAWDAAACEMLSNLPTYDPAKNDGWKDALVGNSKEELLRTKLRRPHAALKEAVMKQYGLAVVLSTHPVSADEVRVTVRIPFPVGPFELSAFGTLGQAKGIANSLSFAMYAMLETHGLRPFSLGRQEKL